MAIAFRFKYDPARLQRHFHLADLPEGLSVTAETFRAGDLVTAVEWNTHGLPVVRTARFGFQMREGVLPVTNYRCESIDPRAPPQHLLDCRAIVPADAFYAQVRDVAGLKTIAYGANDAQILGLAAMLRPEPSGVSVVLLTVAASLAVRSANGRMPAIICNDEYDLWLDDTSSITDVLAAARHNHDAILVERREGA